MKKFSTAGYFFALATACAPAVSTAQASPPAQKTATATQCSFLDNAPDQHKVVRGDTLWDIAGKFLQKPWCWPQVWDLNREQIRNPHWIYPGQIVYFDRAAGKLRLAKNTSGAPGGISTVRLSPQMRIEGMGRDAIPAIPAGAIEPFLSQPLVIEDAELAGAARIISAQEGRVNLGKGDIAYVRGDLQGNSTFQVFRPAKPLLDPITREIIAYESAYLGTLNLTNAGKAPDEAHRMVVTSSRQEMGAGDLLIPMPATTFINYVPHAPEAPVDARIVSIYGGVSQAGQNNVVALNKGRQDGLDIGTVLQLHRTGKSIVDRTDPDRSLVKLPDEQYGNLFVFRVFNKVSYGLIMQVKDVVEVGDTAASPR